MMHDWQSLSHVRWDCKYHVVIVPKYRRRSLYGKFRGDVGRILRYLCDQKGVEVLEGTLRPDHVHMCLRVAPKFSIAFVIGFLKGKNAVRIHRESGDPECLEPLCVLSEAGRRGRSGLLSLRPVAWRSAFPMTFIAAR